MVTLLIGSILVHGSIQAGTTTARIVFPFFKNLTPDLIFESLLDNPFTYPHCVLSLFFVFLFLVLVGASNAVNLTDGLDGLAIGLTIICAGALTVLAYIAGHREFAEYLDVARVPQSGRADGILRVDGRRQPGLPLV